MANYAQRNTTNYPPKKIDAWWRPINPDYERGIEALYLGSIDQGQSAEFPDKIDDSQVDSLIVTYPLVAIEGLVHRFSVSREDGEITEDGSGFNVVKKLEDIVVPGERTVISNEREGRAGELVLYLISNNVEQ